MATPASAWAADTKRLLGNEDAQAQLRATKPWLKEPRFFTKVKVSATAAMKMTSHAAAGVEKGLSSANRMPVEVMGLMHGHLETAADGDAHVMVVTDVFPLPVEGTETAVVNLDPSYLISLSESLESTRRENFMGWYHSHPFDVAPHSNAFLSGTDVSTQLQWQISEDRAGNPWLAIVIDPLRGIAKGRPEMGAFRCYPTDYTPPKGLAPDGVFWPDERARNARWGESCVSYYTLDVEYFMSSPASALMAILARDYMWARVLSTTPSLEKDARDRVPDRVRRIGELVDAGERAVGTAAKAQALGVTTMGGSGGDSGSGGGTNGSNAAASVAAASAAAFAVGPTATLAEAAVASSELAGVLLRAQLGQAVRRFVFCRCGEEHRARAQLTTGGEMGAGDVQGDGRAGASTATPDLQIAALAISLERTIA